MLSLCIAAALSFSPTTMGPRIAAPASLRTAAPATRAAVAPSMLLDASQLSATADTLSSAAPLFDAPLFSALAKSETDEILEDIVAFTPIVVGGGAFSYFIAQSFLDEDDIDITTLAGVAAAFALLINVMRPFA